MVRATVVYQYSDGKRFDTEYYTQKHLPLVRELLGDMLKGMAVERGLSGAGPHTDPLFVVLSQFDFDTFDDLQEALATRGPALMADRPNFTDITPVIQVSEVLV